MPPIDDETRRRIDQWIKERNLNPYGDPHGTAYPGGTPLFSEKSGRNMDRHEYILRRHPELRPK